MRLVKYLIAALAVVSHPVAALPTLFGLGESTVGYYQLDTTTINNVDTKTATAWVIITQAQDSQAKKLGADFMLIMFTMNCPAKTIQPLAWKAKNMNNQIIAEGIHGKEKQRTPQAGSMDERILRTVCHWKQH